jgi:hypothetical protein
VAIRSPTVGEPVCSASGMGGSQSREGRRWQVGTEVVVVSSLVGEERGTRAELGELVT